MQDERPELRVLRALRGERIVTTKDAKVQPYKRWLIRPLADSKEGNPTRAKAQRTPRETVNHAGYALKTEN